MWCADCSADGLGWFYVCDGCSDAKKDAASNLVSWYRQLALQHKGSEFSVPPAPCSVTLDVKPTDYPEVTAFLQRRFNSFLLDRTHVANLVEETSLRKLFTELLSSALGTVEIRDDCRVMSCKIPKDEVE